MKNIFKKYCTFSIFELVLAGLLVGVFLIFAIFIKINITNVMEVTLNFVFFVIFGFIFGPVKGALIALIGDTLALLFRGLIATWMWQYELSAILIPGVAFAFLYLLNLKGKSWFFINIFIAILVFVSFFSAYILDNYFNISSAISLTTKIVMIILAVLCFVTYCVLFGFYFIKKNESIKMIISFFSLAVLVVIIFSWLLGTYSFIIYLNRFAGAKYSIDNFPLFLIPRIFKSFITVPIYTFFFYLTYIVLKHNTQLNHNLKISY